MSPTAPPAPVANANGIGKKAPPPHPAPSAKRPFSLTKGPYFAEPPKDTDNVEGNIGYQEAIQRLVANPIDVDGIYGADEREILPLPFDCPKAWEYIVDMAQGTFAVVQSTIVMFLSILVDNAYRSSQMGPSYNSGAQLIIAVVIIYPLFTLLILVTLTAEYTIRKFMYYRLLSLRILVDWENIVVWKGFFFWYYIATWCLLNAWSIWGVVEFWTFQGIYYGPASIPFATFVVVNLQVVQILLVYIRLVNSESRLVSLNQVFEKEPIEADMLLKYTYVVEEVDLMNECRRYGTLNRSAFFRRLGNLFTCGLAFRHSSKADEEVKFDIERLKGSASNGNVVRQREKEALEALSLLLQPAPENVPDAASPDAIKIAVQEEEVNPDGEPPKEVEINPNTTTTTKKKKNIFVRFFVAILDALLDTMYRRLYAVFHSFLVSIMIHSKSWPYRPDVPYFRIIVAFEFFGYLLIAGIIAFGLLRAASSDLCNNGEKTCRACNNFINETAGKASCSPGFTISPINFTARLGF